jgi:hypothetical protein
VLQDTLLEISGRKEEAYAQRAHAALQRAARVMENAPVLEPADKDEAELLKAEGLAQQLGPLELPRVEVVSDEEEDGHGRRHKRPEGAWVAFANSQHTGHVLTGQCQMCAWLGTRWRTQKGCWPLLHCVAAPLCTAA